MSEHPKDLTAKSEEPIQLEQPSQPPSSRRKRRTLKDGPEALPIAEKKKKVFSDLQLEGLVIGRAIRIEKLKSFSSEKINQLNK
jgi:hypothetical protein